MKETLQKIKEICKMKLISCSTLQRYFAISFPKSAEIIDKLIEDKIIERVETGYKVLHKRKLSKVLKSIFINE